MRILSVFVTLYILFGLGLVLKFCNEEFLNRLKKDSLVIQVLFYICATIIGPFIYLRTICRYIKETFRRGRK